MPKETVAKFCPSLFVMVVERTIKIRNQWGIPLLQYVTHDAAPITSPHPTLTHSPLLPGTTNNQDQMLFINI